MHINEKLKNYVKLISAGLIILLLFIKSPLNPLYSDYNIGELKFMKLQFIFWIVFTIFSFWMIFFISRSNYEKHLTKIFIFSTGLFFIFFIFYGLDVLDSGFHLSKQWAMFHGLWKENFDAIAGTNLLGGLWLLIPGEPLLLWARLGFIIVQLSITFISYKILLLYFSPKRIFITVLILTLFLSLWQFYFTINYDNLPFLFFAISTYYILKGLKSEAQNKICFIISGVLAIVSVFCRITYITALFLPVFLIILDNNLHPKNLLKSRLQYLFYGFMIGLGVMAAVLFLFDGLNSYLNYFFDLISEFTTKKSYNGNVTYSQDHSFLTLYSTYKKNILEVVSGLYKYIFIIVTVEFLRNKSKKQKILKYVICLVGSFILYYNIFEMNDQGIYHENVYGSLISFIISIYILWIFASDNYLIKKNIVLIAASIGLFIFSFIGSDLAFRAAYHSGSGLVLFSLPLILIQESELSIFNSKFKFSFLIYFILIVFSFNIVNKRNNLYREPNFRFINTSFNSPSLAGIKSNPQRVDVVDSLLVFLNNSVDLKQKNVFFTHHNSLMYFLTQTNYMLNSPWDVLNDFNELKESFDKHKPDVFVIPKESHRYRYWPFIDYSKDSEESYSKGYYDFYEKFIKDNGYEIIYKNSFYTVYSLE